MTLAFIFPGQGSQAPGMGKALADAFPAARAVVEEVDAALGQKLSTLMFEGPAETLTLTENAQPALLAASIMVMRALEAEHGIRVAVASFVAGHSLGETSALCAAGGVSLGDAARFVKARGKAMQAAAPVGAGAMAALLGAEMDQAQAACAAGAKVGVCEIANDNTVGQIVISGEKAAVEAAVEAVKALGVRKAMLLPVSAPFHCSMMQPAADAMAAVLAGVKITAPAVPLVANVTAQASRDPEAIRRQLVDQIVGRVRWRESMLFMAGQGVTRMAEAGAGKALTGMVKRTIPDVTGVALNGPEDLAAFAQSLAAAS